MISRKRLLGAAVLAASLAILSGASGDRSGPAEALEIPPDCLGHLRSAIARGALEGRSRRDEVTGEPYTLPSRMSGDFNPGLFRGTPGGEAFLAYIGIDQVYLDFLGCVLSPRLITLFCIDFDASDRCPPADADGDGWSDRFESNFGSDPYDSSSIPELLAIDEWRGTDLCGDGIDNDGDRHSDRSDDGCRLRCEDFNLTDLCSDADRDGWLNIVEGFYESDPENAASTPESPDVIPTCADGIDNDLDGLVDEEDAFCGGPF